MRASHRSSVTFSPSVGTIRPLRRGTTATCNDRGSIVLHHQALRSPTSRRGRGNPMLHGGKAVGKLVRPNRTARNVPH